MPGQNDNDVEYNEYSLDFLSILDALFSGGVQSSGGFGSQSSTRVEEFSSSIVSTIDMIWSIFLVLSWLTSIILIFGIVYAYLRDKHYSALQDESILIQERLYAELYGEREGSTRWQDVLTNIATDNPRDWRLAIIEADIMLEEVLETAGYPGNTVGEKLKGASSSQFTTLDQAWSAHLVRNKIAHAGSDFVLTKRLAQETITQYKMVFEEHDAL